MTEYPLVSVVMPSFNQANFIERSVESVLAQEYPNVELIVGDGGSRDGTVEVLKRLSGKYPRLRWFSEPDNGPADALNKALTRATGEYVGWLNSDDLYTPGAIRRAISAFRENPDWIMCYGHGEHVDKNGEFLERYPTRTPDVGIVGFVDGCFICQPSMFFKQAMYLLLGPLDETQKTSFDYEYWLRAFQAFPGRIGFVDAVQAQSRLHDECITMRMRRTVAMEGVQLSYAYFGRATLHWLTTYIEDVSKLPDNERGFANLSEHVKQIGKELAPILEPDQVAWLDEMIRRLPGAFADAT
nr:glycosyltransferase family 2 protein [uncultured Hyphomonas sp.]